MTIPKKAEERILAGIKKFLPILVSAKTRDDSEGDTVRIITDMLGEVFGYDKYTDLTSEYCIRGTYCDLAVKVDSEIKTLIEIKAIGTTLKDSHTKQTVDYGVNKGIEWVILTNGLCWKIYRVFFGKPITTELVTEINLETDDLKREETLQSLFLIAKEGWAKDALENYHQRKETVNKFFIAGLLQTEGLADMLRREIRKINPEVKVTSDQIARMIKEEVLKRDTLEGEKALESQQRIQKFYSKAAKAKAKPKITKEEAKNQTEETPSNHNEETTEADTKLESPHP